MISRTYYEGINVRSKRKGPHAASSISNGLAAENVNALMEGCHDYAERWSNLDDENFPPLPLSPLDSPVPKKDRKSEKLHGDNIIETLSKLINERADGLELKLGSRIEALEKKIDTSMAEVKELKENLDLIRNTVSQTDTRTTHLMNCVAELEAYSRRWNLKLCGLSEREDEDARLAALKICQAVIPEEKNMLVSFLDIAHCLGPKKKDQSAPRPIIIRFLSRRLRDVVWKAAKKITISS